MDWRLSSLRCTRRRPGLNFRHVRRVLPFRRVFPVLTVSSVLQGLGSLRHLGDSTGRLHARSAPIPSRGRRRSVAPFQHPPTRRTDLQYALELPAPLNREAHAQCHLLTREAFKICGLFQRPIQPGRRDFQSGEIHAFDLQHPNQLTARRLAIVDGRPQGLARTVNKNAQEPPSDELKVDEFIAQARERLFNGQL